MKLEKKKTDYKLDAIYFCNSPVISRSARFCRLFFYFHILFEKSSFIFEFVKCLKLISYLIINKKDLVRTVVREYVCSCLSHTIDTFHAFVE